MLNENFLLVGALLLFVAVLAGKAAYRLGAPALLLFLGVGMLFGYNDFIAFHSYDLAQFVGMVAMCIILFSGGMDTKFSEIRSVMAPGLIMATLGVMLTTLFVGGFVYVMRPLVGIEISLPMALLLAATMSSTDSAPVFSILRTKKQGLKQNLRPLLELESGSNDPMAYILTVMLVGIVADGTELDFAAAARTFFIQMGLGAVMGYGLGRISVWVMNRINIRSNPSLYSVLLLACAFFTFAFTTMAYGNGYLAVYIAGLVVGNFRIVFRNMLGTFFDSFTWLLQIVLFLALGLFVDIHDLLDPNVFLMAIAIGLFMIFIARPISTIICMSPFRGFSRRARVYASWVGLRGAVPIIFALYPLTHGVANADYIFNVVFLVTIISLVVQGTTVGSAANLLDVADESPEKGFDIDLPDEVKAALTEVDIIEGGARDGALLRDVHLPEKTLVMMIRRGDKYIVPNGNTTLHRGDKLLLISEEIQVAQTEIRHREHIVTWESIKQFIRG